MLLRKLPACALVLLMIGSSMVASTGVGQGVSRTGATGNEPTIGFYEGNDSIAIFHLDGTNNTSFALDETVYMNVTTDRVVDVSNRNRLRVNDYLRNRIVDMDPAFTQTDFSPPTYSYEASFLADSANFNADHYVLEFRIGDNSGGEIEFKDTLVLGGGATPAKSIITYLDDTFTTTGWVYNPDDVIYIEIWADGVTLDLQRSDISFENYQRDNDNRNLDQLVNSTNSMNGDYLRTAFDLVNDLNQDNMLRHEAWWYFIEVDLDDDQGANVIRDWVANVYINYVPIISDVIAHPSSIDRKGTMSSTISSEFTDLDASGPDDFTVLLEVREPDDQTVITIVDNQTNGNGGLTVTDLGNGLYNATYDWDPADTATLGLYDLQMTVTDTYDASNISTFADNPDELNITDSGIDDPVVIAGNVTAIPVNISRAGTTTTTLRANFTDSNDDDEGAFNVTFKVRDELDNETVLVDSKLDGEAGLDGVTVSVTKLAAGQYQATYVWDPNDTVELGLYDLYFNVTDPTGLVAEDIFTNNENELELFAGGSLPVISNVTAVPGQVDKMGNAMTTLGVEFSDPDGHNAVDFNITFRVRDPADGVIEIATDVGHGGTGNMGETMNIVAVVGGFVATMDWDPPETALIGLYDLNASVEGPADDLNGSGFDANLDELNVTTSNEVPVVLAGNVIAMPPRVPRLTNAFTSIEATFTDEGNTDPLSFNVTFKVKDSGNTEHVLMDDKGHGGAGEFGGTLDIKLTGNHFKASYAWDPPDDQPLGMYDLYFLVTDGFGTAEDLFDNNQDELEIIDAPTPLDLVIGDTFADPPIVNKNGTSSTTLYTNFTDPDELDPANFTVTFRVRSPTGLQIDLAVDKVSGERGEGGGMVTVANMTGGWQASVTWDPSNAVELGTYDLFCRITDPNYEVADGFGANLEELEVIDEVVAKIKDVKAVPAEVKLNGTGTTNLMVEFQDASLPDISTFLITIKVRDVNGTEIVLVSNKASGGLGEQGGQMVVSGVTGNYTATYEWLPSLDMVTGKYDLYAKVVNGAGWVDESGFGANVDELELIAEEIVGEPVLQGDIVGKEDKKTHRFVVTYKNAKNMPPDTNGIVLVIGAQRYTMLQKNLADVDYTDGKDYYFLIELGKGEHDYSFEVTDTTGQKANLPSKTIKIEDGEEEVESDLLGALLGLLLLLIVILLVYLVTRKKGSEEEEEEDPPKQKGDEDEEPEEKEEEDEEEEEEEKVEEKELDKKEERSESKPLDDKASEAEVKDPSPPPSPPEPGK